MNYYTATELAKDGKPTGLWHYTRRNDGRMWPVGYCAENCPGHATPDEAREHYRQYQIDTARDRKTVQWGGCEVCDTPTKDGVCIEPDQMEFHHLCPEHHNRATLETLIKSPGDMIASV